MFPGSYQVCGRLRGKDRSGWVNFEKSLSVAVIGEFVRDDHGVNEPIKSGPTGRNRGPIIVVLPVAAANLNLVQEFIQL